MVKKLLFVFISILMIPAVIITANNIITDDFVYETNSVTTYNDIYTKRHIII